MLLGESDLGDKLIITGVALAILSLGIISSPTEFLSSNQNSEGNQSPTAHISATIVPSTLPTIVHQQLSSTTTTVTTNSTGSSAGNDTLSGHQAIHGQGHAYAYGLQAQKPGNRYGVIDKANDQNVISSASLSSPPSTPTTTTVTWIVDQVTVIAVHGTIPGHNDTIVLKVYYGSATPYCTSTTSFDATGLTSYTTTFKCQYMGMGTYNFKVEVFDDYGTLIGDPATSLSF